jgi:hypothetical protein
LVRELDKNPGASFRTAVRGRVVAELIAAAPERAEEAGRALVRAAGKMGASAQGRKINVSGNVKEHLYGARKARTRRRPD